MSPSKVDAAATAGSWSHFEHGADVGVRGTGPTMASAFEAAARALTAIVVEPSLVRDDSAVAIHCDAPDPELLLVDWLNALIYEMATRRMLFARFEVAIEGAGLRATAWGEPVDRRRHQPVVEPKGATLTALRVSRGADDVWLAQCVVDV